MTKGKQPAPAGHFSRAGLLAVIAAAIGGQAHSRWTKDSLNSPGWCAQNNRETIEAGLDIPAATWQVYKDADKYRIAAKRDTRHALDYEAAARAAGLEITREQLEVGDQIYWPWKGTFYCEKRKCQVEYAPGHVVTYAGDGMVLENSNQSAKNRLAAGAKQPIKGAACVFLTPLAVLERELGKPSLYAVPHPDLLPGKATPPPAAAAAVLLADEHGKFVPWNGQTAQYGTHEGRGGVQISRNAQGQAVLIRLETLRAQAQEAGAK